MSWISGECLPAPPPRPADWPAGWPWIGDPCHGYQDAADCQAVTHPDGPLPVLCTRDAGHAPPHVADGLFAIVHVWT